MCDQTEVTYSDGDVVWVKIGPIWWPGVVKDVEKEGKQDEVLGGLRQKPIATVQFFDEDKYEFVKNLENIYHYNCRKKEEFLKKGLDKFRSGAKHMTKFPEDVRKAEELVKGDVNILDDPRFAPAEKTNYSGIFGTPKPKKKKTDELTLKTKILPLKKRLSTPGQYRPLSQIQYRPDKNTPRRSGPLVENGADYYCPFCDFTSHFIDAISWHFTLAHSAKRINYGPDDNVKPLARVHSEPMKRAKKPGRKSVGRPKSKETPSSATEKKSETKTPLKRPAVNTEKSPEKKKRFTDALLADWSEDDDTKDNENEETIETNTYQTTVEDPVEEKPEEVADVSGESADPEKKENSSCFDFEDEDDGFIGMSNANTYGRKIPRVIPPKDKTDLGMDLDIEELFKRKPDSDSGEGAGTELPVKKRRGRPPRSSLPASTSTPVSAAATKKLEPAVDTLAATRERRPGARKSYLNEVIEKVDESGAIIKKEENEELPKSTSRRKQDLKRQSLRELEDIDLDDFLKKKEEEDSMRVKKMKKLKEESKIISPKKNDDNEDVDLTAQVESLLAETATPVIPSTPSKVLPNEDDLYEGSIEYLEDDPEPISPPTPVKPQTPIKRWHDEVRSTVVDTSIKKSSIPQWKQNITEALKSQTMKTVEIKSPPTETSNVVKVSKVTGGQVVQQKGGTYYIVKQPARPKILGKPQTQQVMLVTSPRNVQQRVKVGTPVKATGSTSSPSSPVVQLVSDGKGGFKKVVSKKVIQISGTKTSPSKYVISGKNEGIRVIENYNGTGKTIIVKEVGSASTGSGQTLLGLRKKVPTLGSNVGEKRQTQCVIKGIKGSDGKYTIQRIVRKESGDRPLTIPQMRKPTVVVKAAEPIIVPEPAIDQPVIEQESIELGSQVVQGTQQVVAVPGPDGTTTYMLVTMNEGGVLQQVDSPLLSYEVQPENSNQIYHDATDDLTPVYSSAGQDILAEALANTNVLESEMSILMPLVQETSVTLQKPIMTPLEIPSSVIPDTSGLIISPSVQETSVTLQKPIMTPVEVPTSIVPDTSGLEPPPLPPTPTEEDVLMEESEGGLMIAEQQVEEQETHVGVVEEQEHESLETAEQVDAPQVEANGGDGDFFIDDSQEGEEVNSFQSMPLLTEETTASEEPIGNQSFEVQQAIVQGGEYIQEAEVHGETIETSEYLPTSTNPDLEPVQSEEVTEEAVIVQEEVCEGIHKDGNPPSSLPFLSEEGFVPDEGRSQETEVSSTTGDSKVS